MMIDLDNFELTDIFESLEDDAIFKERIEEALALIKN